METETKNLAALVRLLLQKKTCIAIHHTEIANALTAVDTASKNILLFAAQPAHVAGKLQEALNVVSNLLFLLYNDVLFTNTAAQKKLVQQADKLYKNINHYVSGYCHAEPAYFTYPVKTLTALLSEINDTLKHNSFTSDIYPIVQPELEKIIETKTFTFHRWLWWCRFAHLCNTPMAGAGVLGDLLIKLNFNIPAFTRFLCANITAQTEGAVSISAKSQLLTVQLLKYKTIDAVCSGYLPAENPVKQKMICFLQTQLQLLPTQPWHAVAEKQSPKLNTCLSVPQLALFIRLLIETKIINETNQSALLKIAASFISTSKAVSISPESLRINYYTPGLAAKNIIKEYLSQMLRLVNSY
jgi:hypothetical protein